jgi:hypothetical protein
MPGQENRLDRVRVASPCHADWDRMRGDERARFCSECQLHVYDISQMTRPEAEALITRTEGRICARIYRRADGTVLTKDCPVGVRALRRRIARAAGAALTALLSLGASAAGRSAAGTVEGAEGNQRNTAARTLRWLGPQEGRATCRGVVTDPNGSVVPDAKATLVNERTKYKRVTKADDEGRYSFGLLEPGLYTLTVESPGFNPFRRDHLRLHSNEELRLDVLLDVGIMGVLVCEEPPDRGVVIDGVRVKIN